jgi:hypothetical protein
MATVEVPINNETWTEAVADTTQPFVLQGLTDAPWMYVLVDTSLAGGHVVSGRSEQVSPVSAPGGGTLYAKSLGIASMTLLRTS